MNEDYMEFLCWINRTLTPDDLADELASLGMDPNIAVYSKVDWRRQVDNGKPLDILSLYQDYCVGREIPVYDTTDVGAYLQRWIDFMYKKWRSYKDYAKKVLR